MLRFEKILVPTDFSRNAWPAVEQGVELARSKGGHLHLLFVVDHPLFGPPYIPQGGFVYPVDSEEGFRRLDEIKAKFPDLQIAGTVAIGSPAEEIVKYADDEKVDVIVMSTHGRRGFSRFVLGSTAESVVRTAKCPVLTIPGNVEPREESEAETLRAEKEAATKG